MSHLDSVHRGRLLIPLILLLLFSNSIAQAQDVPLDSLRNRKKLSIITAATLQAGTLIALDRLWYQDHPRSSFHFFQDGRQWLQMDKVGHGMTSYYLGVLGMETMRWAGWNDRQARWYGGMAGLFYLTSIEVLDGFSEEWGASPGDMMANTLGAGVAIGQDALWNEQRITFKFSFHRTDYAPYRPGTLGDGWNEELLKDYNGQSYWLSANIASFLSKESDFPKWLSVAVGYGVDDIMSGTGSFAYVADDRIISTDPRRQWYLAPDIDLWRIPTRHKGLKTALRALGFIRLPLPALMLERGRLEVRGFGF